VFCSPGVTAAGWSDAEAVIDPHREFAGQLAEVFAGVDAGKFVEQRGDGGRFAFAE